MPWCRTQFRVFINAFETTLGDPSLCSISQHLQRVNSLLSREMHSRNESRLERPQAAGDSGSGRSFRLFHISVPKICIIPLQVSVKQAM